MDLLYHQRTQGYKQQLVIILSRIQADITDEDLQECHHTNVTEEPAEATKLTLAELLVERTAKSVHVPFAERSHNAVAPTNTSIIHGASLP